MKDKGIGSIGEFKSASLHFRPVSKEVASIFIDGLLHVIKKPQDMITRRTNPSPSQKKKL